MSALIRLAAWGALIGLGLWIFGGLALRAAGALSFAGGLLIAADSGSLAAGIFAALGAVAWLAGHWLFAARNHFYRSPLARRLFLTALTPRLDPTRGWGVPNVPPERRG
jgi:hypothetical protein